MSREGLGRIRDRTPRRRTGRPHHSRTRKDRKPLLRGRRRTSSTSLSRPGRRTPSRHLDTDTTVSSPVGPYVPHTGHTHVYTQSIQTQGHTHRHTQPTRTTHNIHTQHTYTTYNTHTKTQHTTYTHTHTNTSRNATDVGLPWSTRTVKDALLVTKEDVSESRGSTEHYRHRHGDRDTKHYRHRHGD